MVLSLVCSFHLQMRIKSRRFRVGFVVGLGIFFKLEFLVVEMDPFFFIIVIGLGW